MPGRADSSAVANERERFPSGISDVAYQTFHGQTLAPVGPLPGQKTLHASGKEMAGFAGKEMAGFDSFSLRLISLSLCQTSKSYVMG